MHERKGHNVHDKTHTTNENQKGGLLEPRLFRAVDPMLADLLQMFSQPSLVTWQGTQQRNTTKDEIRNTYTNRERIMAL